MWSPNGLHADQSADVDAGSGRRKGGCYNG
jgi:hypothetical protein